MNILAPGFWLLAPSGNNVLAASCITV